MANFYLYSVFYPFFFKIVHDYVDKTESLSTSRIFSKLLFCRQFCRQSTCRRQHYFSDILNFLTCVYVRPLHVQNQFFISIANDPDVSNGIADAIFERIVRAHRYACQFFLFCHCLHYLFVFIIFFFDMLTCKRYICNTYKCHNFPKGKTLRNFTGLFQYWKSAKIAKLTPHCLKTCNCLAHKYVHSLWFFSKNNPLLLLDHFFFSFLWSSFEYCLHKSPPFIVIVIWFSLFDSVIHLLNAVGLNMWNNYVHVYIQSVQSLKTWKPMEVKFHESDIA